MLAKRHGLSDEPRGLVSDLFIDTCGQERPTDARWRAIEALFG